MDKIRIGVSKCLLGEPVRCDGQHNHDHFIERVFTLWRFRQALRASPTLATLMTFHARNKLLIQSHHEALMREMGRELGGLKLRNHA